MLGYDSDTVMPTVIITGKDGKIVWTHETDNYRVRPEPDTFLEVLRRHGMESLAPGQKVMIRIAEGQKGLQVVEIRAA